MDLKEYIGHVTSYQLQRLFQRFYPDSPAQMGQDFAEAALALGRPISAAQVQGLFLMYKHDPQALFDHIDFLAPNLNNTPFPSSSQNHNIRSQAEAN